MEVVFKSKRLQRCYEDSARAIRQWGSDVARKYIMRIGQLYEARDFQQAYRIRSMRLHPLKGSKRGDLAIDLTGKWRLIVMKGATEESVIIREINNHYDD